MAGALAESLISRHHTIYARMHENDSDTGSGRGCPASTGTAHSRQQLQGSRKRCLEARFATDGHTLRTTGSDGASPAAWSEECSNHSTAPSGCSPRIPKLDTPERTLLLRPSRSGPWGHRSLRFVRTFVQCKSFALFAVNAIGPGFFPKPESPTKEYGSATLLSRRAMWSDNLGPSPTTGR